MRVFVSLLIAGNVFGYCEPKDEIRKALFALPPLEQENLTWREKLEPRKALAEKYPDEAYVHFALQDAFRNHPWMTKEWNEALESYRKMPLWELGDLLRARLQMSTHPAESRKAIEGLLEKLPGFGAAHIAMLDFALRPTDRDAELAEKHFQELMLLCPGSVHHLKYLNGLKSVDTMAVALREAPKALEGRTDPDAMKAWTLVIEYSVWAKDAQVPEWVKTLRGMKLYDRDDWVNLLNLAYLRTKEEGERQRFLAEVRTARPDSRLAISAALAEWEKGQGDKWKSDAAAATEHQKRKLEFARELHRKYPKSPAVLDEYIAAAGLGFSQFVSDEEALEIFELRRQQATDYADRVHMQAGYQVQQARALLYRKLRLETIPALCLEAVRDAEMRETRFRGMGGISNAMHVRIQANEVLVEYFLLKKDTAKARALLTEMRADVAQLGTQAATDANVKGFFDYTQQRYLELSKRAGLPATAVIPDRKIDWSEVERVALADFEARDLSGRTWKLADWKGKTVLVSLWATWCLPCREELPIVQRLYEEFKNREDRLVIALNVDDDAEAVQRFVKDNGYTFPVIASRTLADNIDFVLSLPQARIIDAEGRKVMEAVPGRGLRLFAAIREAMDAVSR